MLILIPLVAEAEKVLSNLCWFPFSLGSKKVEVEGAQLFLDNQTSSRDCGYFDCHTYLEIPPNAIEENEILSVNYGITPSGPFSFPKGYNLCSMVVYVVVRGAILKKPMKLHLPHWYHEDQKFVGDTEEEESPLKCCWSPHTLKNDQNKFLFDNYDKSMYSTSGTAGELLINGNHCLFAIVCKAGVKQVYETHVLRETETSKSVRRLYIVTTFKSYEWRQV